MRIIYIIHNFKYFTKYKADQNGKKFIYIIELNSGINKLILFLFIFFGKGDGLIDESEFMAIMLRTNLY